MKTKFAIGCLVQWYEIEIIEEYIDSLKDTIDYSENTAYLGEKLACIVAGLKREQIHKDKE